MTDFFEKESFLGATVAEWLLLIASMLLRPLSRPRRRPLRSATLAG